MAELYHGEWEGWVWWPVEVDTLFAPIEGPLVTSPHPQHSVDMQFVLVQSLHLVGFHTELTSISIGRAIPR